MRQRLKLDRLAHILAASRLSQNHWAIRLGLSRGHWSDIVNGRHPYPSAKTRQRMAEVLGVPAYELFEPEDALDGAEIDFRMAIAARYELMSELGQGGMGTVYLANDRDLGRLVAIKVVSPEAVAGIGADQLLQEIAHVARLQHPNVLPLFDAGERAGSPFYVMPYIREGSLGALLRRRGRLPVTEALDLVDEIAGGLAHAHEHQVLHCDVKPENVLVQGGHAWVMDFGIARKLHAEALEWTSLRKELDFSAGTPAYVSPEQAAGDTDLDPRSDVYSLACVTYELLSGRAPFGGASTQETVSARFAGPPPPLRRYAPDVPEALAQVIARAMSVEREGRPGSAHDFAGALRAASRGAAGVPRALLVRAVRVRHALFARHSAALSGRRRSRLRSLIESTRQDAVYAVRQMRRGPRLAAIAILTLGLGIALTTSVFAAVDGVLLRPLRYEAPDRLVALQSVDSSGRAVIPVSADNWYDWSRENRSFASMAIYMWMRVSVAHDAQAVRASAALVSPAFFDVFQSRMVAGRRFGAADAQEGTATAAVSESFWRSALAGRPIGEAHLSVNGSPVDVVGVVADGQEYPAGTEIFLPYHHRQLGGAVRNNVNWLAVGRLAPGASLPRANADLDAIARHIRNADPAALYSYGVHVTPLRDEMVGDSSSLLRLLMGSVALVLLITCANLASANLARGASRSREMAVRAALGAGRGRIVRQLLVEHLMLALAGGSLGAFLAWTLTRSAGVMAGALIVRADEIAVDGRVLVFAALVAAAAGVLTGVLPALQAARASPANAFEGGTRGAVMRGGRGLPGRLLVGAEIAMALMLLAGAGLLIQSLRAVLARPLGFQTSGVVTAQITLGGKRYGGDPSATLAYWRQLLSSLRELPGVQGAGVANWIPLGIGGTGFIEVAGKDIPGAGAGYRIVSEGYFQALGIPLLAGRDFDARDDSITARVVVINRQMAERYWPGEEPLGKSVRASSQEPQRSGAPAPWLTIVGVVGNVRHWGYESEFAPEMYTLYRQLPQPRIRTLTAVVRLPGADARILQGVRERIARVDASVPADIDLLQRSADRRVASRRFAMIVLGAFGALSLVLACLGVYGVLSFAVARRGQEMAVRAALGAGRGRLLRLVLGSAARVVLAGTAAGVAGALLLTRLVRAMLYQVSPRDPLVLTTAAVGVMAVAALAALIPARRATRIEPMRALKGDG